MKTRLSIAADERGAALLSTVLTVLLLTAIGAAMLFGSNMDTAINANYRDKQLAQYAALSGVQEARDRIQPSNVVARIDAPEWLPEAGAANVIYIVNPRAGETVAPWDEDNPFFDNQLCQERVLGLSGTPGVGCTSTASGSSWYTVIDNSQSSSAPWNLATPLETKWTRIMLKANNMGVVPVNGDIDDATQVCWDGKQQVPLPEGYVGRNCGPSHKVLSVVITNPGAGYTQAPVITIDPPEPGGVQATAVAKWDDVPIDQINSIVVVDGGSNYTSPPDVEITGGGGSGATAVAEIVEPGAPLKLLTLHNPGQQCFASVPSVSISGGGGSGATGTATLGATVDCIYAITVAGNCPSFDTITFTVSGGGGSGFAAATYDTPKGGNDHIISGLSLPIINPGSGYNGTAITVTASGTKRACNGVTATPAFGYRANGLTLGNPGANYLTPPAVLLGGGVGSGVLIANASATLDDPPPDTQSVTRITVTNPGSGYTSPPTVTLTGGGGTGAQAVADLATEKKLVIGPQFMTEYGDGYISIPKVTISPALGDTGSGAEAYATVDGVSGLTFGMVYQLTSLAVTRSGARAMTQMEVATPVRGLSLGGALTLGGPQPIVDQLPSSSVFFVDGNDNSNNAALPQPPGCDATPNPPRPAFGAYDDPNASTIPTQSAVDIIKEAIPEGRTNNYQGSGPSPDVQNVYGTLGDTLTSPTGLLALHDALKSAAGANVFPSNYNLDQLGPLGSLVNPIINFVDGDVTLQGNSTGYGILVVTGTLRMGGNFTWNGLVLVIGDGKMEFQGGGNGHINGQAFASKFWDHHTTKNLLNEVGSPELSWAGGGGNGVFYNHCWADDMLSKFAFLPPPATKQLKVLSTRTVIY